jgi:Tol biopolymer transport system component
MVVLAMGAACGSPGPQPSTSPISDSSSPTAPVLPGKFAFTVLGGDLWVMRGDGSDRRQITLSGEGVDTSPSWAPDGSRLAFRHSVVAGDSPQNADMIRIVRADGSGVRDLVAGSFPAWSPDGAWIAFRGVNRIDLAIIRPDGTSLRPLGVQNAECPVWSPDGTRLLYCRNESVSGTVSDNWEVWMMNRDGSDQHQLTEDPARDYPITWSSDGSRIVFFSERGGRGASFIMKADGSDVMRLTEATDLSAVGAWLPDGRFVIASAGGDIPDWYLIDGNGARQQIPQLKGAFDPIAWVNKQ